MIVRPFHRYLDRFQLVLPSQIQQLRIEAPPFDSLPGKDYLDCLPGKRLEAALCVAVIEPENDAQSQVKKPSIELAIERLTLGLHLAFEPARPDGDVCSIGQRREQLIGLGDGRG